MNHPMAPSGRAAHDPAGSADGGVVGSADLLGRLRAPDIARLTALQGRLVEASGGELDLAYRIVDTAIGELLVAASTVGVVRVAFAAEGFDAVLDDLADRVSPRILRGGRRLDTAARQLTDYCAGRRRSFELPLDHRLAGGFRLAVQRLLPQIGYGQTHSYAELAQQAGRPGAARAVGTACATNPLPVVLPCHRVVRSDGSLGHYVGGTAVKAQLLKLEQGRG